MPPEQFEPPDHEPRRTEDDPERRAPQLLPRRNPRELAHDEPEFALDGGEVGTRLIDLPRS